MSASHLPAMRATALHAAAALARYERHVRRLAATWLDMDLYQSVSNEIDEIKVYCATLPQLARGWSGLLISHAELVHALWRGAAQDGEQAAAERALRLQEHLECIDALARECLRTAEAYGERLPRR